MVSDLKAKSHTLYSYMWQNTDLWIPFGPHILKTCGVNKGEADKEDVLKIEMVEFGYNYVGWYRNLLIVYRLWVGERPEPIIIFLTSCVPESQVDWPAINLKENISKMDLNISSTLT